MIFICLCAQRDDLPATAGLDGGIGSCSPTVWKDRTPGSLQGALLALFICWHTLIPLAGAAEEPYDYPFADPYVSTVLGTPKELQAEIPQRITVREPEVTVFENRPIPDILWYSKKLRYSIATQDRAAPLIFLVAGMGAGRGRNSVPAADILPGRIPRCLSSLPTPDFIPLHRAAFWFPAERPVYWAKG
jgi:hypothetical protein